MNDRLHPQDLRAMMAAHIYGQGLQLIAGAQWQNVNDHRQTVYDVDALLAELESTEKPQHQGPFGEQILADLEGGGEAMLALARLTAAVREGRR